MGSLVTFGILSPKICAQRVHIVSSGTSVMDVDGNRVFVQLNLRRPNGTLRRARFWVDTGGDTVMLAAPLARELGLKPFGSERNMGGMCAHAVPVPKMYLATLPLDTSSVSAAVTDDAQEVSRGIPAEGILPGPVLKHYDALFDYPARRFTLAQPGTLKHRGAAIQTTVQPHSGYIRMDAVIESMHYGFMLDTGGASATVSQRVMDEWTRKHPAWHHSQGAVGVANMVGGTFDVNAELVRVPTVQWGPFTMKDCVFVSRSTGVFESYMAPDMSGPIVGAIGGSMLKQFRIEVDYTNGVTYVERRDESDSQGIDTVGIILRAQTDRTFLISGVALKDGLKAVKGIDPGDRLLRVDSTAVTGASLAHVLHLLRGQPGQRKILTIQRGYRRITRNATVGIFP